MGLSIIQVDAFTSVPFAGNPAAVCVLSAPHSDEWMQAVAREMNLSETAFLLPETDGYRLRWFTPAVEVALCGHATLASAHVLWSEGHLAPGAIARFYTLSGRLTATQQGDWIELDFPATRCTPIDPPAGLLDALGLEPGTQAIAVSKNQFDYLVEVASLEIVRQLAPDFTRLRTLPVRGVIVTSRAEVDSEYDFISRFFAPGSGVDEDPVTGSAHCALAPYWGDRLSKDTFLAYQASARGGVVKARLAGDRVFLGGQAVTVLRGELVQS
ncbi:PhzF family phenazine biosynthesis protein [Leptolyngbya sp. O-77]|uniref:PhzF family phenazine biosynthesis protein n=1 Tax=Leptolyngbya sp. O-77 TaxID=1080068 RepID=UPI00074D2C14|nr:PhzF family phenazine biosynthesis protein [Leptolyngbya sp. O-77]BAU42474.1 putative isomerase YddE [Leptolyngbya sp. O-77]